MTPIAFNLARQSTAGAHRPLGHCSSSKDFLLWEIETSDEFGQWSVEFLKSNIHLREARSFLHHRTPAETHQCVPAISHRQTRSIVTARCYVERSIATESHPSVCPSVTLRYCNHIGWKSSKIISRLGSLGVFALWTPNITHHLLRGEHPEIFARIGVRCGK